MGGSTLFDLTRDVPGVDHGIPIGVTALTLTIELTESHTEKILRAPPGNPEEDSVPCFLAVTTLSCTCTLFGCRACRLSVQAITLLTLNLKALTDVKLASLPSTTIASLKRETEIAIRLVRNHLIALSA